MESSVLDPDVSPQVSQIIKERYVAVELFTDLPRDNPLERINLDLLTNFNNGTHTPIPVYMIVTPDGKTLLDRRFGRQSTEEFLRFLNQNSVEKNSSD